MFKYNFFLFKDLPSAWLCGVRVKDLNDKKCVISVRHNWFNSNPFKSLYWAVQGMGAELATGAVPFAISRSMSEKLRMFVVGTDAKFIKRAKGRITFRCDEVMKAREAIEESMKSGKPVEVDLISIGRDKTGEIVSEWIFKWNFLVIDRS